jgi:hypothetical protein
MSKTTPSRLALLACDVFEQEIACHGSGLAPVATEWFEMGLHDRPDTLRATLQAAIDRLDARDDIDAVVLAYGLCGRGAAGLRAGRHPLVIPRAHDCITVFLGSKERYAEHQKSCPSCYYYTPGWNRKRRVPGPERLDWLKQQFTEKFAPDDVDFLVDTERQAWAMHDTATYLHLGTPDAAREAAYARSCADWLGWKFEPIEGDPALLRDLLEGRWDDARFQIVPPGSTLGHAADDSILRVIPPAANP